MDTVKGSRAAAEADHTECLITLTERKTRAEIIRKLPNGNASSVVAAINGIERSLGTELFCNIFKSISPDNGGECALRATQWTLRAWKNRRSRGKKSL
jgi:IS30 family transposase